MQSAVLRWWFLIFAPILLGADAIKDFVSDLSKSQKTILNEFLLTIAESPSGHVLFGDRPMSIEAYDTSSQRILTGLNPRTVALAKGKELWEDFNISPENKEYSFTTFESDANSQIICINRRAFLQVVKENIALFRYVLGPALTPEGLLNALTSSENRFYEVLKNNQVLLGILLGHGKQNSLVHSRLTFLSDPYAFGYEEEFPFISKKLCRSWAASSKKYYRPPSFGFHSINEEELALSNVTVNTSKLKNFNGAVPYFDCEADSEETKVLLGAYEQNRAKIAKAIANKSFLEETVRKFCTTASQTIEAPLVPKPRELCLPANREETAGKLIELIQRRIASEPYANKKFQHAFLQGVAAREKGKQMPVPFQLKRFNDIFAIKQDLECSKNLERANAYFERLSTRDDLIALVPNELYFKVLKNGKGEAASSKTTTVSFQYSVQILGDNQSKTWGIVSQEELGSIIPGVAYALIGMQQGEERVIYIHPKFAYGEDTFYPPNISMVAQVRLLDFEEGDQGVAIFPAHQLEERDYKDLLARFEVLRGEEFFDEGVEFWDTIKKSGDYIDFPTFQQLYTSYPSSEESSFQNKAQETRFVADLEYHLLSLQKKV
jgi:FKBP-type peptidyl-prolyl cis-trans isomerase